LAYLHPAHFSPQRENIKNLGNAPFFILRFAKLTAHHDEGRKGINTLIAEKLINILSKYGRVYITSERELEPQFEQYRIAINPLHIHDALYFAQMYIGDSQTMAAEAAVLGTPAIRFNDFVGQISYLEELEKEFALTFGFKTNNADAMLTHIESLLNQQDLKQQWQDKRSKMLSQCIDLNQFMIKLLAN
jgi:predicted glycosyltransferase